MGGSQLGGLDIQILQAVRGSSWAWSAFISRLKRHTLNTATKENPDNLNISDRRENFLFRAIWEGFASGMLTG